MKMIPILCAFGIMVSFVWVWVLLLLRQRKNMKRTVGDWRIQKIPYKDAGNIRANLREAMSCRFALWVSASGLILFMAGFGYCVFHLGSSSKIVTGLTLAVTGWIAALIGSWLKARKHRQNWGIAYGHCIDREVKRVWGSDGEHSGGEWSCRVVCEYEHAGMRRRVTPALARTAFSSEKVAIGFLEKRIAPDGRCRIRYNLENPLETELYGESLSDKLAFKFGAAV